MFFFCSYDARISFENLLTVLNFLLIVLLCILLRPPGPISSSWQCFSICHWNLNSITAHNYAKLSLLTAYNLVHGFNIIYLSEIYLNSETPPNDTHLELPSYNMFRSDHPSNNKRGGVCIYYKSTLPLRILKISILGECINFEISIAKKICRFIQ